MSKDYKSMIEDFLIEQGINTHEVKPDEDCICRKGVPYIATYETIYYCEDREAWILSLERFWAESPEETEIQYCPYCGRRLDS